MNGWKGIIALYKAIINWLDKGNDESIIEQNATLKNEFDNLMKKKQLPYKVISQFKGSQIEGCDMNSYYHLKQIHWKKLGIQTPGAHPLK